MTAASGSTKHIRIQIDTTYEQVECIRWSHKLSDDRPISKTTPVGGSCIWPSKIKPIEVWNSLASCSFHGPSYDGNNSIVSSSKKSFQMNQYRSCSSEMELMCVANMSGLIAMVYIWLLRFIFSWDIVSCSRKSDRIYVKSDGASEPNCMWTTYYYRSSPLIFEPSYV